jgi:catechol 2,3-dioxygenase-like lactoylglutathione lyase family enzyme
MKTSGITATLPAQDLGRAKAFYSEKVGLEAVESHFLEASDGRVGLIVGDGVNQLFVSVVRVDTEKHLLTHPRGPLTSHQLRKGACKSTCRPHGGAPPWEGGDQRDGGDALARESRLNKPIARRTQ